MSPAGQWRAEHIGDLRGRTAVVTGPTTGGLGYHTALELARHGARVVLAGRSAEKVEAARRAITAEVPSAALRTVDLDLASFAAVRMAAGRIAEVGPIHVLVNNAGVMATPQRRTVDGLDLQMATNHFGPFLLTGLLLPLLSAGRGRVVTVSSLMHRAAREAPLGDPRSRPPRYHRWQTYAQTKLANLLFTYEADRRFRAGRVPVSAVAAHPGIAGTHLLGNGQTARSSGGVASILDAGLRAISQPAYAGAWPVLMAATADVPGSSFCGPGGRGQLGGPPRQVTSTALSHDQRAQRRLWELSEETAGLSYP